MPELSVRRWQKDDKDRLYVKTMIESEFTSVGYVDVKTGFTRSTHPDFTMQAIYDAAATYAVRNQLGLPAARFEQRNEVTQHHDDISKNKAGKSVRAQSTGSRLKSIVTGRQDSWAVGAKGESEVGKMLDKAKDVKALHSVVINEHGADIDHILFTPYGVYTVNTKTHYGAKVSVNTKGFFVNGTAVSHIKKAKIEAERVSYALTQAARTQIPVTPMIVIVGAASINITVNTGVLIVPESDALTVIRSRSSSLSPAQVEWLYERAKDPATWQRKR